MLTRTCVHCGEAKTIRGVWYMLPGLAGSQHGDSGVASFVCESCYVQVHPLTA